MPATMDAAATSAATSAAIAVMAAGLAVGGYGFLALAGLAPCWLLLPSNWRRYWLLLAPILGWLLLSVAGYPLNVVVPFPVAAGVVLGSSLAGLATIAIRQPRRLLAIVCWRQPWREAAWPAVFGALAYAVTSAIHVRQGTLALLVVDRDAEHYYDTIAALLQFPIGLRLAAWDGLEGTPVGPPYYVVHLLLTALSRLDPMTTAVPSHLLMLALGVQAVYLFARTAMRLRLPGAVVATGLYALGAVPVIVAGIGFPHQTAGVAAVPFGLAALIHGVQTASRRALCLAGLGAALAGVSNYPVTVPLIVAAGAAMVVVEGAHRWRASTGASTPVPDAAGARRWLEIRVLAGRVALIGVLFVAGGALTHATAVAYVVENAGKALVTDGDREKRSVHVPTFASPAAALGVAPLDLFRDIASEEGQWQLVWGSHWPASPLLSGTAMIAAAALIAAGLLRAVLRLPLVAALLLATIVYEAYFRVVSPFPYWEFKILSSAWFLLPCLAALGAARSRAMEWPRTLPWPAAHAAAGGVAAVLVAVYAAGLGGTYVHALRFLALPWGAALPEREIAAARAIVRAVPEGARVYVSGDLVPQAARPWTGVPLRHERGSPSVSGGADYLSRRWRGLLVGLLAYNRRPVYGVAQRDSSDLIIPAAPAAADFLLLDVADDPRLYGVLPEDLEAAAGTLRLYRQTERPVATLPDLAAAGLLGDAGSGPPRIVRVRATGTSLMAIHEAGTGVQLDRPPRVLPAPAAPAANLPGGVAPARYPPPPPRRSPAPAIAGSVVIGFHAVAPAHVELRIEQSGEAIYVRRLALTPGLTWYTSPERRWPVDLTLTVLEPPSSSGPGRGPGVEAGHLDAGPEEGRTMKDEDDSSFVLRRSSGGEHGVTGAPGRPAPPPVRLAGIIVVEAGPAASEQLERSETGATWPLLTSVAHVDPSTGRLILDTWFSYLGPREGNSRVQLRQAGGLWSGGHPPVPTILHVGPGHRTWGIELDDGAQPEQWSSDGRTLLVVPPPWQPAPGDGWVWLEIGPHRDVQLHQPPLFRMERRDGGPRTSGASATWIAAVDGRPGAAASAVLPLLSEPVALPAVPDRTLVKGTGDDLFYLENGRLRWVPALEALARNQIEWRLQVLDDHALWRLPVALPLP